MTFTAPVQDQMIALQANAGIDELIETGSFGDASQELVEAIVTGIGEFAAGEWAPINRVGDTVGAQKDEAGIRLPDGYKQAYARYVEQGWSTINAPTEFGGQGLPFSLAACALETLGTANCGFTLLPLLTVGAIEALERHGSGEQKRRYLPNLITGKWSGTMNLTEPQAGSDVGAVRTTATPITEGEHAGKYRIKGTKIYITFGEHDLAENIIHLVLARLPEAPSGSRGISLFVVPRLHVSEDGQLGEPNDVRAVSIEHKMGLHASPTCVMSYGDEHQCIGELVGEPHQGLKCMFTMMNSARVNVANQGVQIAEASWRKAAEYAQVRVQSPKAGSNDKTPVPIIEHPDVRRMILRMRSLTEGARALLYYTTGQVDRAALGDHAASERADILVPLAKAWCTDIGCEVASLGIQVHGGMGFIEETGAAQFYRDARIMPIYEGTNGIQAADLVTRKLGYRQGQAVRDLLREIEVAAKDEPELAALTQSCLVAVDWMLEEATLEEKLLSSVPFCTMFAVAVAGWQLLEQRKFLVASANPAAGPKGLVTSYFNTFVTAEVNGLSIAFKPHASIWSAPTTELVS